MIAFLPRCPHDAAVFSLALTLLTLGTLSAAPPCPTATASPDAAPARCIGLRIHHAVDLDPATRAWLDTQLAEANRLFAAADLAFTVTALVPLPEDHREVRTREDRDALGHDRFATGTIDVYVVAHLGDVDLPGQEIRGVHWRSRKDRARRYVIVSTISPPKVLAHELGHFFGLPHSRYPESIMNKAPRATPPYEQRRFADRELSRITTRAKELLRTGALTTIAPPGAAPTQAAPAADATTP